jgi:Fe-S oxidoreductase
VVLVPECGHAYPALRWEGADEYGKPLPFEVYAISEYIGREIKAGRLKLNKVGKDIKYTYHDPCKLTRHGGILQEPRAVFEALGADFAETPSHGNLNWCCGGGAGVFVINPASELRQRAFEIKMAEVDATGADAVVTSCGSCRLNFMRGKDNAHWGKDIKSLVALASENLADLPKPG